MKKFPLLCLTLVWSLSLTACGTSHGQPHTESDAAANYLGKYLCTSITMDNLTMNPAGKWLTLKDDGTASTFLTEEESEAEWKLSGDQLTMTVAGKTIGTGKLQGSTLTLEMMGMEYTFSQEGVLAQEQADGTAFATFTCYGNLYAVRYPTALFRQDPAGLSDLYSEDGTQGWITKLDTSERVNEWLAGFDEKRTKEGTEDYQRLELTVSGYPASAIIYRDETSWRSEVIVNFGSNVGNERYPMYAAYLYFTGDTYMSVWSEEIQGIVNSLTL